MTFSSYVAGKAESKAVSVLPGSNGAPLKTLDPEISIAFIVCRQMSLWGHSWTTVPMAI